jgi:hypothetical protein
MYLFTTITYPNDKSKEVAEMYLKAMTKYPDDNSVGTPLVPAAIRGTPQGIKSIAVSDVKKGKFEDAHAIAVNRLVMFRDIPGFRYSIKTFINLEEAMKAIGM